MYGITSTQQFNPTQIEDTRTAFEKMSRDFLIQIFHTNGIQYQPTATKDVLLVQLSGVAASGRQILIPTPQGPVPMQGNHQIAPTPVNRIVETPAAPPPTPQPMPTPAGAPVSAVAELTGGGAPVQQTEQENPIIDKTVVNLRVRELEGMKFLALKSAGRKVGVDVPGGMSVSMKKSIIREIAEKESEA